MSDHLPWHTSIVSCRACCLSHLQLLLEGQRSQLPTTQASDLSASRRPWPLKSRTHATTITYQSDRSARMPFEEFLSPGLPGLIYETHSEQSQSPHSNDDTQGFENDWMNWNHTNEDSAFHGDPIFNLLEDDFLNHGDPLLTDKSLDDKATHGILGEDNLPTIVTPDMLMQSTADSVALTDKKVPEEKAFLVMHGKRKLSQTSNDSSASDDRKQDLSPSHSLSPQGSEKQPRKYNSNRPPKVSHNVIEKRYRSNLNDKINDLRDAVPSLKAEAEIGNVKHPKGKIIQAAAEYIRDIEQRCVRLQEENNRLTAKLHSERQPRSGGLVSKVVVGGLASMMCASNLPSNSSGPTSHAKRSLEDLQAGAPHSTASAVEYFLAIVKMLLLVTAILYIFNPDIFAATTVPTRGHEKYSQSAFDDTMQEDLQENREAVHDNVSAMLKMPRDRPGLFKRIIQGCVVLLIEMIIGQSGWDALVHRGLDYAQKRQNACRTLIETQLLGGDKNVNQAKLFLSAIQSLGYTMPKEMRALHFAMVCHGYVPAGILQFFISWFWSTPSQTSDAAILALPLSELFSQKVLDAMWAWTTGIEDPLISNVRSDETINNPLRQLSSIHASLLQNAILRAWLRGTESAVELDRKTEKLLLYSPAGSKIMTNSVYLQSMIEPNDWLERAMIQSLGNETSKESPKFSHEVTMQLRCCVLLNLLEKDSKLEEVSDVLQMAEVETSSLLPGYSSRIVAKCIAKYRLDDDDGISEVLRKICSIIASSTRQTVNHGRGI